MIDNHPARGRGPLAAAGAPVRLVLVVANQTATSNSLVAELRARAEEAPVFFHLVVPALNSRLRHWLSDIDDAVSAACRQGDEAQAVLKSHGLTSSVEVGDGVPLLAIEDALARFAADEIVISTLPPNRSHWLEQDLVQRARARFGVPVSHVIAHEVGLPRPRVPDRSRRRLTGHLSCRLIHGVSGPRPT